MSSAGGSGRKSIGILWREGGVFLGGHVDGQHVYFFEKGRGEGERKRGARAKVKDGKLIHTPHTSNTIQSRQRGRTNDHGCVLLRNTVI